MNEITKNILDDIELNEFLIQCGNSFNGIFNLDTDGNSDIDYYSKLNGNWKYCGELREKELVAVKEKTQKECEEIALAVFDFKFNEMENDVKENNEIRNKYENMLNKVKELEFGEKYLEFQEYVIELIDCSIKFDCYDVENNVVLKSGEEWRKSEIKRLESEIKYFNELYENNKLIYEVKLKWIEGLNKFVEKIK